MRTSYVNRISPQNLSIQIESILIPYYKLVLVVFMKAFFDAQHNLRPEEVS